MTREEAARLAEIVERFSAMRIGVVGDLVVDIYVHGVPERVSREAPVLILGWESEELIPGGAANTANNLLALGAEVHPVGVVGDDAHGRALLEYLETRGVERSGIFTSAEYHTVTKTRVMAGGPTRWPTQVVRIDKEPQSGLPSGAAGEILKRVRALAEKVDGWIFSDYGYDVAAPGVAAMLGGVRVADSRARIEGFKGFTALTPNEEEAAEVVGHPVLTDGQVRAAGKKILERTEAENVVITRGNKGMALVRSDGSELFLGASGAGDVTDVTGAGDTVTGVLALALAAGAEPADAARLANHAAGVVVMKAGAATLTSEELAGQLGRTE
jgi:rfaE bifunctional protein kinase chain/domain